MRTTFSIFSDAVFSAFTTFLLSLVILNYYVDRPYSLVFATCFGLIISIIVYKRLSEKTRVAKLNKKERLAVSNMVSALNLYTKAEQNQLFLRALENANYTAEKRNGGLYLSEYSVAIFPCFGFNAVDKTAVVKAFNYINKSYTAYILAGEFSKDILQFIERFDGKIKAIDGVKVYGFLNKQGCLPKTKIDLTEKDRPHINLTALFDRKKAKRFLLFGILFLFMSYLVPIKLYYVIFGCIFLIYSLICRFYGKTNTVPA